MPELPEVQTTVDGINAELIKLKITDVWTDYNSIFHAKKENIKNPEYFTHFRKDVLGATIVRAHRIGKNILIELSNGKTVLTHMKMTGHYLYGEYVFTPKTKTRPAQWEPKETSGPLRDPYNRHIHLVFSLSNNKHLAFADPRKFAKIFVFDTHKKSQIEDLMHIGPDPLSPTFTFEVFKTQLYKRPNWKIKQALLAQDLIAGIGNIYSDEMLWLAGIHPLSIVSKIPEKDLKELHKTAKPLLQRGIDFGGDSDSDYRNIYGVAGNFQNKHNAYRRTGEKCPKRNCSGTTERIVVGARSAHYCNRHQRKY